jgi:hypothetical protein
MSPFYTTTLVLNPVCYTRYIETHWPRKWTRPVLAKVKELWEKYRTETTFLLVTNPSFSYDNSVQESQEPSELDAFDRIANTLRTTVIRPSSGDEYIDYNSEDLYDPGKKGALAWWL